jgi:GNAT superfamily N-acetyltransferase
MSDITYKQIDQPLKDRIVSIYGDWIHVHGCLVLGEDSYAVAALSGDKIAGFAGTNAAELSPPLNGRYDAFINCIEVDHDFRRRGIGRHLIGMLEEWAKTHGYRQIRAWSSEDKVAALNMWYALNYGMCPATETFVDKQTGKVSNTVKGYVYAKVLNPGG